MRRGERKCPLTRLWAQTSDGDTERGRVSETGDCGGNAAAERVGVAGGAHLLLRVWCRLCQHRIDSTPANRPRATAPISRSQNGPLALSARNAAAARSISSSRRGIPGAPSRALRPTRPRHVIHPGAGAAQAGAQRRYAQCAARPADPAVQRRPERSGYPDPPLVPLVSAKQSSGTYCFCSHNPLILADEFTTFLRKFDTDEACRAHLESVRWPEGPVCPRCGTIDQATPIPTRPGLYRCGACRKQFTVTVGTVMEGTHLPLRLWYIAMFLI